jgi:glycosyltransferase involved in cell wall biosynthesis
MNPCDQPEKGRVERGHLPRRPPAVLMMAYTHYESDPRVIRAAEAALEGGFAVDVIALKRLGQLPQETIRGVRVYRVQARYRGGSLGRYIWEYAQFVLRSAAMAARFFLARRYKVVHVHNMPDALVFAALVPKLCGAKIILDIHDPMPETYGSKFRNLANRAVNRLLLLQERLSVAFADATITVSEPVKNAILVKHGYRPEQIGVVANFADDQVFRPIAYLPLDGVLRFVFHGTILERYGLRTLIEAVAKVRRREKIRVRIIGEGDFSSTLKELIQSYGVGEVVEFVNHVYPLPEIPKLLTDCHVGLVPLDIGASTIANYALPLKLVEYSCLGLPSISIRNAAIEYYFRPDECMFFNSGDTAALAQLLDQVAGKPDCLVEYRKRLEGVRTRLLWSKEKAKYIKILLDLARQSDSTAAYNV